MFDSNNTIENPFISCGKFTLIGVDDEGITYAKKISIYEALADPVCVQEAETGPILLGSYFSTDESDHTIEDLNFLVISEPVLRYLIVELRSTLIIPGWDEAIVPADLEQCPQIVLAMAPSEIEGIRSRNVNPLFKGNRLLIAAPKKDLSDIGTAAVPVFPDNGVSRASDVHDTLE